MLDQRFTLPVFTSIMICRDNRVLLLKRSKHKICGGYYAFPGGGVDGQESIRTATIREAFEEVGITIDEHDLKFVHVYHFYRQGDIEYINFFFKITIWQADVENKEPDKCDELLWVPFDQLPEKILPGHRHALKMIEQDIFYSEFGWNDKNIQLCKNDKENI